MQLALSTQNTMKHFALSLCFTLISLLCVGQTKKVAILETVDREQNIPYAVKLIIRSNLAKAITDTPGYEAFDRTDMDAIFAEQNFQRTGMVSNEQIKRLGEMTGASFVLVAEAVKADQQTIYIIAKLLDVETGRIEATDNQLVGAVAQQIQQGCMMLSRNLLKGKVVETPKTAQAQQPAQQQTQPVVPAVSATPAKKTNKDVVTRNYQLVKIKGTEYNRNGDKVKYALTGTNYKYTKKEYEKFLELNCPAAWKKYKSGKSAIGTGWTFFILGTGIMVATPIAYNIIERKAYDEYYSNKSYYDEIYRKEDTYSGYGYGDRNYSYKYINDYYPYLDAVMLTAGSVGATFFTVGLITFSVGYGKKGNAYKVYNKTCSTQEKTEKTMSLNLQASNNGFGLALNF